MKKPIASKNTKSPAVPGGYTVLIGNIGELLETARRTSARAVNAVMTATYWEVGRRIVEFEQGEYGDAVVDRLAKDLAARLGRGFSRRNVFLMRAFYAAYPYPLLKNETGKIVQTLSAQLPINHLDDSHQIAGPSSGISNPIDFRDLARAFPLPWSHYVQLVSNSRSPEALEFYHTEALRGGWSVRQLKRQIDTQFYERTALSTNKVAMLKKGGIPKAEDTVTADEEVKDPLVLEFLGLKDEYSESELEEGLIKHLEQFLLELGNDFTFVARQRRLRIDDEWFRVDLLFFHRRLRCLVILDLKLGRFTHADAGQMHVYLNYAREHWSLPDENPPVGIILCAGKGDAIVRYATDNLPTKVLVREYLTALPDEKSLAAEITTARRNLEARKS
ncbi:MAG: PDDEXK nuclease domain-containing protein [Luteolibacter sp.]